MTAESTPQGSGTNHGKASWNLWFRDFFKYAADNNVKAISYINSNWEEMPMWQGQGWGECAVENDEFILSSWKDEISKDKYLKQGAFR
jgi:hypothetical protein